ncbi:MAG TPA: HYR domain-containing protein, partial [Saprospiraceae bacterium]|nr:HYR domain-containing protein [Saprospiraceae bacterium]
LLFGNFAGQNAASREICLLKTDKQGNVLWGKSYGSLGEDRLSDAILVADTIYLIGSRQNGQIFDILVGKVDLNGEVDGQCSFVKNLDVTVLDYAAPLDFSHDLEELDIAHNYATAPPPAQTAEGNVTTEVICQKICETCDTVYLAQIIEFCPGDSVLIGGVYYTQPGTVLDTISGSGTDCDTVVTYTLQFFQNSIVQIQCPADVSVETAAGANSAIVNYNPSMANTDCPCSVAMVELLQGPASGSDFPVGATQVCYEASDDCGGANSCCFTVTVQAAPPEDACDVKNTPCVKFEILGIFQNPAKQRTYRMRVTNSCTNKLIYTTFQLPDGVTADEPATNTTYTAPSSRQYEVRNPNFSPAYSIRFKAIGDGIANGQSDVFEYTLPPQSEPLFIHATAKLFPQVFYETHLNVFDCIVQQTSNRPAKDRQTVSISASKGMTIFPNPASEVMYVQLPDWANQQVQLRVTDAYGRQLFQKTATANVDILTLELPTHWPAGVYYLEAINEQGERQTGRFVRVVQW